MIILWSDVIQVDCVRIAKNNHLTFSLLIRKSAVDAKSAKLQFWRNQLATKCCR